MSITLQKIAKLANVSVSTASKALRYSKEVHEETAELVRAIAKENGYFLSKKIVSRQNRTNQALKIALLSPEIISIHYASMISKLWEHLTAAGMQVRIFISHFDQENTAEILKRCLEDNDVAGVVSFFPGDEQIDLGFPIIMMGESSVYSCVMTGVEKGIDEAITALMQRGHTRIAFFGERLTTRKGNYFQESLIKHSLPFDEWSYLVSDKRFEAAGYELMDRLKASGTLPTAVICAYDEIALGAIKRLNELGLSCPEDISFIGINGIPMAEYSFPTLSTLHFDTDACCEAVVKLLTDELFAEKKQKRVTIKVPYKLIMRDSVKSLK